MQASVLLVDDEPNIPKAIKRALRHEGYHLHIANDANEALARVREKSIDVIVSDHRMPGMSGADLLAQVRHSSPDTVRIMLSGQADITDVVRAVNEGAIYKFITKPWCNDNLRAIVREATTLALSGEKSSAKRSPHGDFSERLQAVTEPGCLVALEVRNASVLRVMQADHRAELLHAMNERCQQSLGSLLLPVEPLEGALFAMLAPSTPPAALQAMIDALAQPFLLQDQLFPLRIAGGYTAIDPAHEATGDWLTNALIALTATSFSGEITGYTPDIEADNHERHSLEMDMRDGLKRNEFFLQVQPQVRGTDLSIAGIECLCRWEHSSRGRISPLQFIDLAERNGFIHDLGNWIIRDSCRLLETLQARGRSDIKVSFNVSPRQFAITGWVDAVHEYASRSGFDASMLEVEITESTVMSDPDHASAVIRRLKSLGVSIAMDDFGTGHSSLGLLNEIPFDVLKFDRTLLRKVTDDPRSRTLFTKLVEMTHELGLRSVAEGVENEAQIRLCQELGCDLLQGYAFYQPVDSNDFLDLLDHNA